MTREAREELRGHFLSADMGISGSNFVIAETGTTLTVTNEGNADMVTTMPKIHCVITGIEKVIPTLEDFATLIRLLPRSAIGQSIANYLTLTTGVKGPGDHDGPEQMHIILIDAGRTKFIGSEMQEMLRCIRCGACMNHCPVYTRVGGHAYEAVYPGPIGKILVPQLPGEGVVRRHEAIEASSLCGACGEVCPVEIPIPELIVRLRREAVRGGSGSPVAQAGEARSWLEEAIWSVWQAAHESPLAYRWLGFLATRLGPLPRRLPILSRWTHGRSTPRPAARTLHELAKDEEIPDE